MPRRWLRFNLRTLFILLTLACVWLGWQAKRARDQKVAVAAIRGVGGTFEYTYQFADDGTFQVNREPAAPQWLRDLVGEDFFITVCDVGLYDDWESKTSAWDSFSRKGTAVEVTDEMLEHLKRLPRLKRLFIHTATPDAGLESVGRLSQLERLNYHEVTDDGVRHLSRLSNLKRLRLFGLKLSDRSLLELARFKQLESLDISSDEITDAGLLHLEKLPALREFTLESYIKSDVTADGMARLQEALPDARLTARLVNHFIYSSPVSSTKGTRAPTVRTTAPKNSERGKVSAER